MKTILNDYIAGVQSPQASGFEHLQTLMVRDKLFETAVSLNSEEKARLRQADRQLLEQAPLFLEELGQMTNLAHERQNRNISALRWWWYLDVIVHMSLAVDFGINRTKSVEMVNA